MKKFLVKITLETSIDVDTFCTKEDVVSSFHEMIPSPVSPTFEYNDINGRQTMGYNQLNQITTSLDIIGRRLVSNAHLPIVLLETHRNAYQEMYDFTEYADRYDFVTKVLDDETFTELQQKVSEPFMNIKSSIKQLLKL